MASSGTFLAEASQNVHGCPVVRRAEGEPAAALLRPFMMGNSPTLGRLFGGEPGKSKYKTAEKYGDLRKQILELRAEQLGAPAH